jgi:hypothetical protein
VIFSSLETELPPEPPAIPGVEEARAPAQAHVSTNSQALVIFRNRHLITSESSYFAAQE